MLNELKINKKTIISIDTTQQLVLKSIIKVNSISFTLATRPKQHITTPYDTKALIAPLGIINLQPASFHKYQAKQTSYQYITIAVKTRNVI
ncbi:hypothetical protein MNBD_GAMMA12-3698 [hydrothermal vent metagenome]|uniref:Uncharacterized protein n=1 Tax=hydrothermal vent metagenome TaxID=652676 RepID=A0A3B0YI12_9ZZZZ